MHRSLKFILAVIVGITAGSSWAEDPDEKELMATVKALKARLKDQDRRLAELEKKLAGGGVDREAARKEMAKVAKEMAADAAKRGSCPGWLDNLKFYGDLRLRYQNDCFSGDDRDDEKNRNRGRFRLRFGVIKTWLDDQLEVGFRLASGATDDPTSSNQTFTDNFSKKSIWIDRAYAKYQPKCVPGLTLIGGKMGTPMVHTDMIWDSDLNLEGVWGEYKHKCGNFSPFVSVGYFVVNEDYAAPTGDTECTRFDVDEGFVTFDVPYTLRDVILVAYQAGFDWNIRPDVKWTSAVTYYDYDHYDVGYDRAGGNNTATRTITPDLDNPDDTCTYTRLAAREFQVINLTNKVGFKLCGLPWSAYFDWAYNCGDQDTARQYESANRAYAAGLTVGKNRKKGDWSAGYKYAYIEANSVPGAFNDSEFGHSNRKGHVWRAAYNLDDFLLVGVNLYLTEPVAGPEEGQRDAVSQVELIWRF